MHFEHNPEQYFFLQRFDLGKVYEYQRDHKSNNTCVDRSVSGNMPKVWGFLDQAKYAGQHEFKHRKYELWRTSFGNGKFVELSVSKGHEDRPALFVRVSCSRASSVSSSLTRVLICSATSPASSSTSSSRSTTSTRSTTRRSLTRRLRAPEQSENHSLFFQRCLCSSHRSSPLSLLRHRRNGSRTCWTISTRRCVFRRKREKKKKRKKESDGAAVSRTREPGSKSST